MGDSMDRVQERVQEELEQQVILVTGRPTQVSNFFCEDCDAAIPEKRRRAIHGVTRCVTCQEIAELKSRHYQGGL
ncbi:DksA-like zinc-finger protein [Erwinia phage ENT90]|uniref:Zinc finger DksA/TraR C4-type domain-containing protein n=2 Tax=root TaxID=1 RepID=F1BUS2_9CAUD|nr:TraR/DksA family transcriptional regulator [Mixta calida]YP_007238043.1 DksA-like zinc-finger protein [Erwinia phage ENT90]AIX72483.1 hypothetical protein PSNIH2_00980 [Pantoea sp. PSNIH2]POU52302.1 hypothetical protein C3380_01725 [Pantoea sp. PSNIH5]POU69800.1 hypothetical protein C3374_04960 [Pantoea sp. PSNIH4]POY65471.1 hypothetical protein C3402_23285 [Pantoea sp. PSNIH3]ADX32462.1 hypothetical protein [Erwinia phage ENT90]